MRNVLARSAVVGETPVAVSLTSYGDRVQSVALAIESIAAGSAKPARLILWLDDDYHVPPGGLPKALRRLQRRGLEICRARNVGPHGKYFGYAMSLPRHELPLVTADDDIMYPRHWLASLYTAHRMHPGEINCHWAKRMTTSSGRLDPYAEWPVVRDTTAQPGNFALGVSGVIYPAVMLNELARRGTSFQSSCPKADDIWLHWTALQLGVNIRQIRSVARHFPMIVGTQATCLNNANVANGGNNACIAQIYSEGDIKALNVATTEQLAR
ncbi:hypothetical protein ACX80Q_08545 [Arthrobacter sp. HLT1-20]